MSGEDHAARTAGLSPFAMRPVSLRFADDGEERRFRDDWARASVPQVRATLLLGISVYVVFGLVDLLIVPEAVAALAGIRAAVVTTATAGVVLLWRRPAAVEPWLQAIGIGLGSFAGLGVVAMTLLASGEGAVTYYAGVLAVMAYAGMLLRLRFAATLATILVILLGYMVTLPLNADITALLIANNLAFAVAVGGMVSAGAYLLERTGRQAFTGRRLVEVQATELADALASVRELSGLIPICAWCHKVRDDDGYWRRLEQYLGAHSRARVSHGMCPECFATHAGEAPA